jgi:hypothetical protein
VRWYGQSQSAIFIDRSQIRGSLSAGRDIIRLDGAATTLTEVTVRLGIEPLQKSQVATRRRREELDFFHEEQWL